MKNSKIDFVVTWVDGADTEWQKEKAAWNPDGADGSEIRYRDWEMMRFWFRGVERFAPWVNRIHFITWGHVPTWLNTENPKLNIVRHSDYMPSDALPTFNSNAIELSMHLIDGLSEQFVYFNDDMFLLKAVEPSDFFRNGLPVDSAVLSPIVPVWSEEIGKTLLNNMFIINKHFDKNEVIKNNLSGFYNLRYGANLLRSVCMTPWKHFPGFFNDHLPVPYLRSTFESVWEAEPELLSDVIHHRFRDYSGDVSHWLMRYWQFCTGSFYPASAKRGRDLQIDSAETLDAVRTQKYSMICINDKAVMAESFETVRQKLHEAFGFLSEPCSFEIPNL